MKWLRWASFFALVVLVWLALDACTRKIVTTSTVEAVKSLDSLKVSESRFSREEPLPPVILNTSLTVECDSNRLPRISSGNSFSKRNGTAYIHGNLQGNTLNIESGCDNLKKQVEYLTIERNRLQERLQDKTSTKESVKYRFPYQDVLWIFFGGALVGAVLAFVLPKYLP